MNPRDRRCLVLGSAPLAAPLRLERGECVVAVNGGIASAPRGIVPVWILNARSANDAAVAGRKRHLYRAMVEQGRDREVSHLILLDKGDGAVDHTARWLRTQGTNWKALSVFSNEERRALETRAGGRDASMTKHALSAGLFGVCWCFLEGAAHVRLEGFSWVGGYAYLPGVEIGERGHAHGDKAALLLLGTRYGAALEHSLPLPGKGHRSMARTGQSDTVGSNPPLPARVERIKVRATRMGWYQVCRRRPGDVFVLVKPEHFSAKWMERVDGAVPERQTGPAEAQQREHREIMRNRAPYVGRPNAADEELGQDASPIEA